jgi:hypothetical protein
MAATSAIPTPEKSGQKEQEASSKATPTLTLGSDTAPAATDTASGGSPSPTSTPDAAVDSMPRTSPEPTSTPISTNLEIIHTRFWPESDTLDRSSAFDFGASATYTSSDDTNAGVTAFGLKAGDAIPNPDNCNEWTIPTDRPFWHDQESYSPGQHTFSRTFTYVEDPAYTRLVVWVRLWQGENNLYCAQRVYSLFTPTSTPIPPNPTSTPIPPTPTSTPLPPSPTSTPIPVGLHVLNTSFWPASETVDRDTLSEFGASITYASSYDTQVVIVAYGLKDEAIPDPSTCAWTIPDGRPFWSTGGEDFLPGQHAISQEFTYEDDSEYTHLIIWVWVNGSGEESCAQHVYTLE